MKINIYPIRSDLSQETVINEDSSRLIKALEQELQSEIAVVNIDDLYNSDLGLVLVQSGGSESKFIKLLSKLKNPIYLLTYGSNNSLAASLEILSYLRAAGIPGEVLHGDIKYIAERIRLLAKPAKRYGVIGKPSDWLIASMVDPTRVKKIFNIDLVDIKSEELIKLYETVSPEDFPDQKGIEKSEITKAMKVDAALDSLIKTYNLDGLTIRCFDLLDTLHTTSCLALALLNQKGIISSCEGDIPALLTMHAFKEVADIPSFQANPSFIDVKTNTIVLAHCTLPLSMCESYHLDTHFESGIGIGIKGELKEGTVTVLKLSSDLKHYFVSEGTIEKNLSQHDLCRTQIVIKLDESVSYFLKSPLGNHHLIAYGSHRKKLEKYLNELGLKPIDF